MPNWVPTFGAKFPGAGAPNWMTAYPTILHTLWRFTGDLALVRTHWPHLQAYMSWYERKLRAFPRFDENPFRRDAAGNIGSTQFPGDWCPPPATPGSWWTPRLNGSAAHNKALGEAECGSVSDIAPASLFSDKRLSSAFAYLKDKANIAEMGVAIGDTSSVSGITPALAANFNSSFFNNSGVGTMHYGSGFQTEQLLPLLLRLPSPGPAEAVAQGLLRDIQQLHSNHTTTGIVGLQVTQPPSLPLRLITDPKATVNPTLNPHQPDSPPPQTHT